MNLLSVTIDNIKEINNDKEIIKFYEENNAALSTRNGMLNKKLKRKKTELKS